MEILGSLWTGLATTLAPGNFLIVFLGVVIGTVIGVLPGLGPTASIALLLPATVGMDMIPSLIFLAGIYYGAMYGGSTTSILVNIPGEAASVVTCIDGYQMARQGRAGAALGIAAFGSFIGGTLGVVAVMLISPFLAEAALKFGAPEYFSLMLMGLIMAAVLAHLGAERVDWIGTSMGGLIGMLLAAQPETPISEFMVKKVIQVGVDMPFDFVG